MYRSGDNYVICDICGLRRHKSECKKNPDGLIVCSDTCYDPVHPLDIARSRPERGAVKDARPEHEDRFLEWGEVTAESL